jgi:hypothetical protein
VPYLGAGYYSRSCLQSCKKVPKLKKSSLETTPRHRYLKVRGSLKKNGKFEPTGILDKFKKDSIVY